jgi:hypothetical protein
LSCRSVFSSTHTRNNAAGERRWGDQDSFIAREAQDELLETLTDSRLEVYEGVGHAVHWDAPERFAADVVEFSRYCAGLPLSR